MSDPILVPISPGELIDKITILEIKSVEITDAEKLSNVRHELDALNAVASAQIPTDDTMATLHAALRDVNKALWDIEDGIRDCERGGDFGDEFIRLARAVYVTNDKRADLKKQINLHLGSALVEEKSYADY